MNWQLKAMKLPGWYPGPAMHEMRSLLTIPVCPPQRRSCGQLSISTATKAAAHMQSPAVKHSDTRCCSHGPLNTIAALIEQQLGLLLRQQWDRARTAGAELAGPAPKRGLVLALPVAGPAQRVAGIGLCGTCAPAGHRRQSAASSSRQCCASSPAAVQLMHDVT